MQNSNLLEDCSNSNLVDGFDNQSNADGGSSADTYAQAGQATMQLASTILANKKPKTDLQQNIKAVCGRKPLLNIGGKKDKWQQCSDRVSSQQSTPSSATVQSYTPQPIMEGKKFLGMPQAVGIVVVVSVIAVAGFLAYKKFAVPQPIVA